MVDMTKRTSYVAATALTIAAVSVGSHLVQGADAGDETVFVPITPCRLVDTRPGDLNTGPRSGKLGANETVAFNALGTGDSGSPCDIPSTATAIATNTVAIAPTARSFLTLYPGGVANPGTANLNFVAGQAPTPNAAIAPLAGDGTFNVFNAFGDVHLVIDVNGYFQPSSNVGAPGAVGPAGPAGPNGAAGTAGTNGANGTDGKDGAPNRLTDEQIARHAWFDDPGAPATVPLGGTALGSTGIATDGTSIYATNLVAGSVSVVNPDTNAIVATIPTLGAPIGIAFNGTYMFVANSGSDSVTVIDPTTNAVVGAPISLGAGANPFGIVAAGGSVYTANRGNGTMSVIDASSLTFTTNVSVGPEPYDIEFDGKHLHISRGSVANGFVVTIDPADNSRVGSTIATGDQSQGMAFTGQHLFVVNAAGESLSRIDPVGRTVLNTYMLSFKPTDITYDGRFLYLVDNAGGVVNIWDPQTGFTVSKPMPAGPNPARIIFDGTNLWVTNFTGNSVTKLLPY